MLKLSIQILTKANTHFPAPLPLTAVTHALSPITKSAHAPECFGDHHAPLTVTTFEASENNLEYSAEQNNKLILVLTNGIGRTC